MPTRSLIALAAALQVAAVLVVPAVYAQDSAAPHLSPEHNILYAHHHDSDTEEFNGWMNTLVTDPTGNDIALGPTTPCCPEARVYTITLAPALSAPFTLDPAGNIVIDAYIGAGGSQGVVRVSTELRYGGELVASGAAQNHVYEQAGTGPYPLVSWTIAPDITEFEPGNDLVWTLSLTGVAVQTVFLSVSAERGSSGITLPILTGGSAPSGNSTGNMTSDNMTSTDTPTASASTSGSVTATTTTTSSSTTAVETSDNATTNATNGDSQDSPAPPLAFAALAVLAAAFIVRRRLR